MYAERCYAAANATASIAVTGRCWATRLLTHNARRVTFAPGKAARMNSQLAYAACAHHKDKTCTA